VILLQEFADKEVSIEGEDIGEPGVDLDVE
jgi:hypothetical protein